MPYIPPVTIVGLQAKIKKIMESEDFKVFMPTYDKIQTKKAYKAVWDLAVSMSFYAMGGKDTERDSGTV